MCVSQSLFEPDCLHCAMATTLVTTQLQLLGALEDAWECLCALCSPDLLLPVFSSSSAAAVIGVVTVMGPLRSVPSDVDEGTLGGVLHY